MAYANAQSASNTPSASTQLWAAGAGMGTTALVHEIANGYIKKPTIGTRIATITGSVIAGLGAAYATLKGLEPQSPEYQTFQDIAPNMPAFAGLTGADMHTPGAADAFLEYAQHVAQSGKHGALNYVLHELYNKGLAEEAALLHNYLAIHQNEPFVPALDAWLTEMGERSPETLEHVTRQAVLMALTARSDTAQLPPQARAAQTIRALVAGLSHDLGKLAIHPDLLHKASRIDTGTLESFLNHYAQYVPDYPEKHADMQFLRMVNGGRIAFDETTHTHAGGTLHSVQEVITKVTKEPLLGEPDFADAHLKASNFKIYTDIKARAQAAGIGFMPEEMEAALLNHGRRGTLTKEEGMLMGMHDKLGMDMLQQVGFPADLGLDAGVMNLDRKFDDSQLPEELQQLRQWIMLTDIAEATTGQRAYNRENGKNLTAGEAMQVLENDAARGAIKAQPLAQFKASAALDVYAQMYPDIPKSRDLHQPQPAINAQTTAHHPLQSHAQTLSA